MHQIIRVGINCRDLSKDGGGTKRYLFDILKSLNSGKYEGYQFCIIHNSGVHKKYFNSFEETFVNIGNKLLFDYLYVPFWCKKHNIDVLFSPKNVIPFLVNSKKVVTIHDLAYFMPEFNAYLPHDAIYMKCMIKNSCKRANVIIAVSENTKKDIVRILGVNEGKIKVIHSGVSNDFNIIKSKEILNEVKTKYQLNKKFILFTGGITPRKNVVRLIEAFNHISDKVPHELVLTGARGWNNKKENELIEQNDKIKKLGFVSDEDMPILYNLADLFVYPSLYEGFGLPLLEAMACGCPVISSNSSSIPEVVGNAAKMVDPYDVDALAKAMYEVITTDKLRVELIKKGLDRAKQFSWEKCVRECLIEFEEANING